MIRPGFLASAVHQPPVSAGDLSDAVLVKGAATALNFAAQVSVASDAMLSDGTWSIQSGSVPTGMSHSNGVVSGTPSATQSAATLTLRYTNSGGQVDVSCVVSVWPDPIFTDATGTSGTWTGAAPTAGVVYCTFTAPDFASMAALNEGLFNIRIAGAGDGSLSGIGVFLRKEEGVIGFASRPVGGSVTYVAGPSFHPGQTHRLVLSYDLDTGDASLMVDGGTVFTITNPAGWVSATSDKIFLWNQVLMGASAGLSSGADTIELYDEADL